MFRASLSRELKDKAERELGETDEVRESSLRKIREWLVQQSFSNQSPRELLLVNFLRGCRFQQEETREKLTHYFNTRPHIRDIFQNREPGSAELEEVISSGIITLSVTEEVELLVIRWEHCDAKKVSLVSVIKLGFMLFDIFINESHTFMTVGHTVIIDCNNLPFSYIRQFSPTLLRDLALVMFKTYPTRIKAIHVVNCCSIMRIMLSMLKPLIPAKIVSRIKLYSSKDGSDILTYIPPNALPKEYGGRGDSVDNLKDDIRKLLDDRKTWFLNENNKMKIEQALSTGNVYV